jgi:beta-glucosidase
MGFPDGFVWGAAAAAYQIEGAAFEDGRGLSVWDVFCRKPGAVWNGHSGAVACDHYHRYKDDVALMREVGLRAYRFSVSWPRVIPDGTGAVNPAGLDFYSRLVDELLAAGIDPYLTLFHWDYPHELHCRGGWLNPDSPEWFTDYAGIVADALSDRVTHWMTLNEPQVFVSLGYGEGRHAPGERLVLAERLRIAHHVLLAHGRAVQALRSRARTAPQIGCALVGSAFIPASEHPADRDAAKRRTFAVEDDPTWANAWWMDPIYLGRYPEEAQTQFADAMPPIGSGDLDTMRQPLDFFAFNNYRGRFVRAAKDGTAEFVPSPLGAPITPMGWAITPDALYWASKFFHERYGLPLIVTENGMSNRDIVSLDGAVHDPQRIDFLARYLRAYRRAGEDGADLRGYFVWSILDNFEWAEGYKERFGLVYVDYPTQHRIPKDSARWYARAIRTNGAGL